MKASVTQWLCTRRKDALNFIAKRQETDGLSEPGASVTDAVRDRGFLSVRPELTARTRRSKDAIATQGER